MSGIVRREVIDAVHSSVEVEVEAHVRDPRDEPAVPDGLSLAPVPADSWVVLGLELSGTGHVRTALMIEQAEEVARALADSVVAARKAVES